MSADPNPQPDSNSETYQDPSTMDAEARLKRAAGILARAAIRLAYKRRLEDGGAPQPVDTPPDAPEGGVACGQILSQPVS